MKNKYQRHTYTIWIGNPDQCTGGEWRASTRKGAFQLMRELVKAKAWRDELKGNEVIISRRFAGVDWWETEEQEIYFKQY